MGKSGKSSRPILRSIRRKKQIAGQLSLVRFFFGKEMNETAYATHALAHHKLPKLGRSERVI